MGNGTFSSIFIGRESLIAHGTALATSADNLANLNTTGFKTQRPDFSALIAENMGGLYNSEDTPGDGVTVPEISILHSQQGSLESTGRDLDFAINGGGYFILNDSAQNFYTRAGNFGTDQAGNLISETGLSVMGYTATSPETPVPLTLGDIASTATPTSVITATGNLDASSTVAPRGAQPTTFEELNASSAYSTPIQVIDSLGQAHDVALHFFHTANLGWTVEAWGDAIETGAAASAPVQLGAGAITFDATGTQGGGAPAAPAAPDAAPVATLTLNAGWSNGSAATPVSVDLSGFTGFATQSSLSSVVQDGIIPGNVTGFSVDSEGQIYAVLDNGQNVIAGTFALATFPNTDGLTRLGSNLFTATAEAGEPNVGKPVTSNKGEMVGATLEGSTVDPADEFIDVIRYQRAYQAGSKVVQTSDEMINTTIQLA